MLKQIAAATAALALLTSCVPQSVQKDNISVVCTGFPEYDFARNIAGDNVNIHLLIPPGSDAHSFDPKPADIIEIENADLFIYGGGESDEWARDILDASAPVKTVEMLEAVETVDEEHKEGMEAHHKEEHHSEPDEHVWTSPPNVVKICSSIADALCEIDSKNEALYRTNLDKYTDRLERLDKELRSITANAEGKTVIFGDRFPFRYLAEEYGLDYYAAFPGCAELTEPAAKTVAFLIDKVREENIPVVFYVEFSNHKICDTISEETGAKPMLLHSAHNLTKAEFESGIGYVEFMENNIAALREALGSGTN